VEGKKILLAVMSKGLYEFVEIVWSIDRERVCTRLLDQSQTYLRNDVLEMFFQCSGIHSSFSNLTAAFASRNRGTGAALRVKRMDSQDQQAISAALDSRWRCPRMMEEIEKPSLGVSMSERTALLVR
jgi:hypothetical protein